MPTRQRDAGSDRKVWFPTEKRKMKEIRSAVIKLKIAHRRTTKYMWGLIY